MKTTRFKTLKYLPEQLKVSALNFNDFLHFIFFWSILGNNTHVLVYRFVLKFSTFGREGRLIQRKNKLWIKLYWAWKKLTRLYQEIVIRNKWLEVVKVYLRSNQKFILRSIAFKFAKVQLENCLVRFSHSWI
jgi:hypothetical protein